MNYNHDILVAFKPCGCVRGVCLPLTEDHDSLTALNLIAIIEQWLIDGCRIESRKGPQPLVKCTEHSIDVPEARRVVLNMHLAPTPSAQRVPATVGGVALGADGKPAQYATITVTGADGVQYTTVTNAEGAYRLDGVPV